ncbi:MAG: hypothetical protein WD276_08525 [Actinomycetota bacterium]
MRYVYIGDHWTDPRLKGARCDPVLRPDGRCVVSGKLANALVVFEDGRRRVVNRRCLRLASKLEAKVTGSRKGNALRQA